jgi:threonine aldolase
MNRRHFLKRSGAGSLPLIAGGWTGLALRREETGIQPREGGPVPVSFTRDGPGYTPAEYISKLDEINKARPVKPDFYGRNGTVDELLKTFAELTGKEAAFFMPSGTLANQLAIQVLSGENSKVFVQETSHVFRDEADAAQSLYGKRLVPLAKGKHGFTLEELKEEISYVAREEYFKTGIGAISIEIPVRRSNARVFAIEELRKISSWCREKGYKLHLDGARLHLAAAWSGISVREYASYFDTVYMCLYKYLGATSGAVLCGPKLFIEPMEHLVKVHGGSMYQNWTNAAMALHTLGGLEDRLRATRDRADRLFLALNKIPGIRILPVPEGSNVFLLQTDKGYDGKTLANVLAEKYTVRIPSPEEDGFSHLHVNEGLLLRDEDSIVAAFRAAVPLAKL